MFMVASDHVIRLGLGYVKDKKRIGSDRIGHSRFTHPRPPFLTFNSPNYFYSREKQHLQAKTPLPLERELSWLPLLLQYVTC